MAANFSTSAKQASLSTCSLPVNKQIHFKSSTKIGYRWNLSHNTDWYLAWNGNDPLYQKYNHWVESHAPGDYRAILQKHIEAGRRILQKLNPDDPFAQEIRESEKQVLKIINGENGSVHPINCIESLVFREFLKSQQNITSKREFSAHIFQNGEQIQILGEWLTTAENPNDFSGYSESTELVTARTQLLQKGWTLLSHFHNHPFSFDNPWGDIGGGLAPSNADIKSDADQKISFSLITNGIETIRFEY